MTFLWIFECVGLYLLIGVVLAYISWTVQAQELLDLTMRIGGFRGVTIVLLIVAVFWPMVIVSMVKKLFSTRR